MNTEQSKDNFEKWWNGPRLGDVNWEGIFKRSAFDAWKASRSALVVELPSLSDVQCQYCADESLERIASALRVAGITVRDD